SPLITFNEPKVDTLDVESNLILRLSCNDPKDTLPTIEFISTFLIPLSIIGVPKVGSESREFKPTDTNPRKIEGFPNELEFITELGLTDTDPLTMVGVFMI